MTIIPIAAHADDITGNPARQLMVAFTAHPENLSPADMKCLEFFATTYNPKIGHADYKDLIAIRNAARAVLAKQPDAVNNMINILAKFLDLTPAARQSVPKYERSMLSPMGVYIANSARAR